MLELSTCSSDSCSKDGNVKIKTNAKKSPRFDISEVIFKRVKFIICDPNDTLSWKVSLSFGILDICALCVIVCRYYLLDKLTYCREIKHFFRSQPFHVFIVFQISNWLIKIRKIIQLHIHLSGLPLSGICKLLLKNLPIYQKTKKNRNKVTGYHNSALEFIYRYFVKIFSSLLLPVAPLPPF